MATEREERETGKGAASLRADLADLCRLAVPVIVSRAGVMTMAVADTMIVGRFSAQELAYQSLANAPTGVILTTLLGLLFGTMVMTARTYGAGRPEQCGAVWQRSLPYAFGLGLVGMAVCFAGEPILLLSGQEPGLAAGGGAVMRVFGMALPWALITITTTFFLEGIKRPIPAMLVTIAANLLNILLNWVLVWGHFGFPALGAVGSAWATASVRFAMAVTLVAYVLLMRDHARYGVRAWHWTRWRDWGEQRRIGYGAAVSIGIETTAFGCLTLLAGWLGPLPLAAFSIVFNLIATVFMVALGLGAATGVRVGIALGRRDGIAIARAGWLGLAAAATAMAAFAIVFRIAPEALAGAYTADGTLLAVTAPLVALAALVLVPDGGQVVMANALRGRGDNLAPTLLHFCSYVVVMIPLAWSMAFPMARGVAGLIEAASLASVVSVILLSLRFRHLARRSAG